MRVFRVRFAASKLAEGDEEIEARLNLDTNEKETLEHIICQMEKERGLDRAAAIADMRFGFIEKVCRQTVVKPRESREHQRSVKIDRFLTGTYTAIPAFIAIMGLVFWLTFNVIGAVLSDGLELVIGWLTERADAALTAAGIQSGAPFPADRWCVQWCRKCFELSADHCDAVFFPVAFRGQRLYGTCGVCDG